MKLVSFLSGELVALGGLAEFRQGEVSGTFTTSRLAGIVKLSASL